MSLQLRNQSSGVLERVAGFNDTDSILSPTSQNPIMNKTVYNALAQKIEKTVNDLVNYYDKSQVYNKTEVRELIGAINTLTIEVVTTLPTQDISTTTIYFVGPATGTNTYDEYVYVNNAWVKIGDTQIDLSNYITSSALTTVLQDYYTKSALNAKLADEYYTKTQTNTLLDAKENSLTFDEAPTTGSNNPVKSGGIKTALDLKQDKLTFDTVPTLGSTHPVTSDGIYTAMNSLASGGIRFNTDLNTVQVYNPNLHQWFDIHYHVLDSLDYIRLQYITVNANTYVSNYPYYLLNENEWELGFDFAFDSNSSNNGALTIDKETGGLWLGHLSGKFVLRRYNQTNDILINPQTANTRHTYVIKSNTTNRQLYVDDVLKGTSTQTYRGSDQHVMFNDAPNTGSYHATGKFYGYWYKSNGELVSNYIPVKRRSNGTVGIYDEIRNAFITPTGGSFSPGPEVTN